MDRIHRDNQPERTTIKQLPKERNEASTRSRFYSGLTKIIPKLWWEQISEYIHLKYNRNLDEIVEEGTRIHGSTHRIPHKGGCHLGNWPKSETRNHERSVGSRNKRCQFTGPIDIIQENFSSSKKCVSQQSTILQHETR